ncbi:hypothetical protein G9A89_001112 [Geosiphon pyriformis]|nr:hypothetical protein G9A89_001112 [Geosiphon pyriformis]
MPPIQGRKAVTKPICREEILNDYITITQLNRMNRKELQGLAGRFGLQTWGNRWLLLGRLRDYMFTDKHNNCCKLEKTNSKQARVLEWAEFLLDMSVASFLTFWKEYYSFLPIADAFLEADVKMRNRQVKGSSIKMSLSYILN